MVLVEQEKQQSQTPEGVVHVATEVPEHVEKGGGVVTTPAQVTAQVVDDSGNGLMQTPTNQAITISLPADDNQLKSWSKGSAVDAITWFALFWLRLIKKAAHFGWRVVGGAPKQN